MGERFGRDRHRPDGDWVQTTNTEAVVGVQHRKSNAQAFAQAVKKAERKGLVYGVQLEHRPDNPHDANAIFAASPRDLASDAATSAGPLR